MSGDRAIPIDPATPLVSVDANGLAVLRHVADHHVTLNGVAGEVTLCGAVILYAIWQGEAPGAPPCRVCKGLDG
jgi:hypothetical protein